MENIEKAKIAFGTIDNEGHIQLLPKLGKHKTSLNLFKDLNVKPNSRSVQTYINGLAENELFRLRERMSRMKRDMQSPNTSQMLNVIKLMKTTLSMVTILYEMNLPNADFWTNEILCETYNSIDSNFLYSVIKKLKSQHDCFVSEIQKFCQDKHQRVKYSVPAHWGNLPKNIFVFWNKTNPYYD